ncbi:MAG: hydroxymethylbilane synthase [Gammaproteobacteria bacterium]
MKQKIIIATRKSQLAMWQTQWVANQLKQHHPHLTIEFLGLVTQGDKILDKPLATVGGKGLFTKALEDAMLEGRADIAVHSIKDIPMLLPKGFCLPVMCERADPTDAFVSNQYASLADLPEGSCIGSSSARRQAQVLAKYPHLDVKSVRGNVPTRLKKMDDGEYDALILASAGLNRLGLSERIRERLPVDSFMPAAGQGAVGIECRENDEDVIALLKPLHHEPTSHCVTAERAVSRTLGGSCEVPIAAHAIIHQKQLILHGLVGSTDGKTLLLSVEKGSLQDAEALGEKVAKNLIQQGADEILQKYSHHKA